MLYLWWFLCWTKLEPARLRLANWSVNWSLPVTNHCHLPLQFYTVMFFILLTFCSTPRETNAQFAQIFFCNFVKRPDWIQQRSPQAFLSKGFPRKGAQFEQNLAHFGGRQHVYPKVSESGLRINGKKNTLVLILRFRCFVGFFLMCTLAPVI